LPGPPPGADTGLPLPPAPGQAPPAKVDPGPVAIPTSVAGPALSTGSAPVGKTGRVSFSLICRGRGKVDLSLPALSARAAAVPYSCARGHARVSMRLRSRTARTVRRQGTTIGRLRLKQGRTSTTLTVALTGPRQPAGGAGVWSDGGLQCASPSASQAYLVAPNFTVSPVTTISMRPWIAWWTASGGWHWLGLRGPNASAWTNLTGTPTGIAEWRDAAGAFNPWTWGPVTFPGGQGVRAVGVFEALYWYGGRPVRVWRYTSSFLGSQAIGPYCTFA
jgi:hypothetical protein